MIKPIPAILLLFAAAAGQTAQPATPANSSSTPSASMASAQVSPDTPVITVKGVCDHPSGQKPGPDCKTVITRAQFDSMVQTIQPSLTPSGRRAFAEKFAEALVIDEKARTMGVDQGERFDIRLKMARTQALAETLNVAVYQEASKVTDKELEDYYHQNPDRFFEADLTRVLVPGIQQLPQPDKELSQEEQDKRNEASEAVMKDEADRLRARAAAGEDFSKLESEACLLAMLTGEPPDTKLGKVRGMDFPEDQLPAMELKTGEVSVPMVERRGYAIYKMGAKRVIPFAEAKEDIRKAVVEERRRTKVDAIYGTAKPTYDEVYFGKP